MEVRYLRIKVLHICKTYFEIREKEIHQSYFQFRTGDMLILMSDGVTKCRNGQNHLWRLGKGGSTEIL